MAMVTLSLVLTGCSDPLSSRAESGSLRVRLVLGASPPASQQAVQTGVEYATVMRVFGPTSRTVSLELVDGFYEGTADELAPGSYTVIIEGLADGAVDHFGKAEDVPVAAGPSAQVSVTFASFVPALAPLPDRTTSVVVSVAHSSVTAADEYVTQWSMTSTFADAATIASPDTAVDVTLGAPGTYHFRVRAGNADVSNGRFSAPDSVTVYADSAGNDGASAFALGFGSGAAGTLTALNILPAGDEDWFAVGLCQGDTLSAETTAARLSPPSPLNTILSLRDTGGMLIDSNDDGVLTDSRLLTVAPSDGTFSLVVAGLAGAIGHYELTVSVRAGARNTGGGCSPT
jgi:hypothetical protein